MNEAKCTVCEKWKDAKHMEAIKDEKTGKTTGDVKCFNCNMKKV